MGIVSSQSVKNTVITYLGFGIGAVNTLFLYPRMLGDSFYGLTGYVLSAANVIMPLMAFGMHNTLIKFFSGYKSESERNRFLTYILLLPMLMIVPVFLIGQLGYEPIAGYFSRKNPIIYDFFWQIPIIGFCMGYFEIFYAWVKVHLQSVFGGFVKEILLRLLVTIGLISVYLNYISPEEFVNATLLFYLITMLIMAWYALKICPLRINFRLPDNKKALIVYSFFIILSGAIANVLLDIDKMMIGLYIPIENIAYYSVAIFIATVISVPSRAMHQIAYPLTARLMEQGKYEELNAFYKQTSVALQFVGGLVFVGILVNCNQMYALLPAAYRSGIFVVFVIGMSKYFDLILGNNNAIIFNSKYYGAVLILGILLAVFMVLLNRYMIPNFGINGAAIATLIAIFCYSLAKLLFVVLKMKMFPFTIKTLYSFGILIVSFGVFYFWEFRFHPILNIVLKSIGVSLVYILSHYYLRISKEVNDWIENTIRMLFPNRLK